MFLCLFYYQTGDVVLLVRRVDAQWLVGRLDNAEGMFPSNFIRIEMPLPGEVSWKALKRV